MYIFIGPRVGQRRDSDQSEVDTWHIPRKINQCNKSTNKIATCSVIWNDEIQLKQGQHVALQLTVKISTHVKNKQFYYSV